MSCSDRELVSLDPPSGQSCGAFLQCYMEMAGGYLLNAEDTRACRFCPFLDADEYLQQALNISYSHRWRNVGLLCVYIFVNVSSSFRYLCVLTISADFDDVLAHVYSPYP